MYSLGKRRGVIMAASISHQLTRTSIFVQGRYVFCQGSTPATCKFCIAGLKLFDFISQGHDIIFNSYVHRQKLVDLKWKDNYLIMLTTSKTFPLEKNQYVCSFALLDWSINTDKLCCHCPYRFQCNFSLTKFFLPSFWLSFLFQNCFLQITNWAYVPPLHSNWFNKFTSFIIFFNTRLLVWTLWSFKTALKSLHKTNPCHRQSEGRQLHRFPSSSLALWTGRQSCQRTSRSFWRES